MNERDYKILISAIDYCLDCITWVSNVFLINNPVRNASNKNELKRLLVRFKKDLLNLKSKLLNEYRVLNRD